MTWQYRQFRVRLEPGPTIRIRGQSRASVSSVRLEIIAFPVRINKHVQLEHSGARLVLSHFMIVFQQNKENKQLTMMANQMTPLKIVPKDTIVQLVHIKIIFENVLLEHIMTNPVDGMLNNVNHVRPVLSVMIQLELEMAILVLVVTTVPLEQLTLPVIPV